MLLVRRGDPPLPGEFAIPGGFLRSDESLEDFAAKQFEKLRDLGILFPFSSETRRANSGRISVA